MPFELRELRVDGWFSLLGTIRRGEHPDPTHLAAALRRGRIPDEVGAYLADLIIGRIVRKRGRPPRKGTWREGMTVLRMARYQRVARDRYKLSNPRHQALEWLAVWRGWKNTEIAEREYQRALKKLREERKNDPLAKHDHLSGVWALGEAERILTRNR